MSVAENICKINNECSINSVKSVQYYRRVNSTYNRINTLFDKSAQSTAYAQTQIEIV